MFITKIWQDTEIELVKNCMTLDNFNGFSDVQLDFDSKINFAGLYLRKITLIH